MNHLNEEELVDHYYGEASIPQTSKAICDTCNVCAESYATLQQDLAVHQVSHRAHTRRLLRRPGLAISPQLSRPVYEKQKRTLVCTSISARPQLRHCLHPPHRRRLLRRTPMGAPPAPAPTSNGSKNQPAQPIILVVLGDHLDRSERLLVELKHADSADQQPVKAEAQDLLSANRLYRESAAKCRRSALWPQPSTVSSASSSRSPTNPTAQAQLASPNCKKK